MTERDLKRFIYALTLLLAVFGFGAGIVSALS